MSTPTFTDYYFGTPRRESQKPANYPFAMNGDLYTKDYDVTFAQELDYFAPRFGATTSWTNRALQSSAFGTSPWAATGSPTRTAGAYSVDGIVLDLLGDATGNATNYYTAAVTMTTDGVHTFSIIVQRGTTPTKSQVQLNDSTASALRLSAKIDFTSTAPVITVATGSLIASPVLIAAGVWRISFTTSSVTAANTHAIKVFPAAASASAGNLYAGSVQLVLGSLAGPIIETTTTARTVSTPDIDDDALSPDPRAYNVGESKPELVQGKIATFVRSYSRLPSAQTSYDTRSVNRPQVPGVQYSIYRQSINGTVVTYSSAGILMSSLWFADFSSLSTYRIYGPMQSITVQALPGNSSGGTMAITYKSSSTGVLNDNDSNATIAAAINGMASVSGDGITVSVNNLLRTSRKLTVAVTVGSTMSPFYLNAGPITAATHSTTNQIDGPTFQEMYLATELTVPGHGFVNGDELVVAPSSGTVSEIPTGTWFVKDADTISVSGNHWAGGFGAGATVGKYTRTYTPGSITVPVRSVTTFYLPGFSAGITTAADIPVPAVTIADVDFLSAIFNSTANVVISVSKKSIYRGTIYEQTVDYVNGSAI